MAVPFSKLVYPLSKAKCVGLWQFLHINVFCGLEMSTSFLHLTVFATETETGLCLDSLQGLQLSVDCFVVFMASAYTYIPNSSFTTCRLRVCGPETYP